MEDSAENQSPSSIFHPRSSSSRPLWPAYAAESFSSVSTTLLSVGIFFYTEHYFHWSLRQNLLLAAAQGTAYVIGSLSSHGLAERFGRRRALMGLFAILTALPLVALARWMIAMLIAFMFFSSMVWPILESLVASDADAHTMSRRVGLYNLVWSATNVVTLAVAGTIIEHGPTGLFIIPAITFVVAGLCIAISPSIDAPGAPDAHAAHAEPEPQLLAQRTQALWLSRIALPATYVVVYSLSAMMPLLPVMQPLDTAKRTVIGSIWMASRWLVFAALMTGTWWHTRPRLLLISAAVMLVAFLGVTIRPSDLHPTTYVIDLASMIAWQILLGAVMGIIYAGSLYFGMVLSEGSTEHGGYHEALIGVGSVIGPLSAALTQWRWPGDITAGVLAVACVVAVTVMAAGAVTLRKPIHQPRV
jgi:MFS family permease